MINAIRYAFMAAVLMAGVACRTVTSHDTPPVAAVRAMHLVLVKEDYPAFYRDWCHPYLKSQVSSGKFTEMMKSDWGKEVERLYASVLKHVDEQAGAEVLIAQPQEGKMGEFEFILVPERKTSYTLGGKTQWHLELQLHEGKWKLRDTD